MVRTMGCQWFLVVASLAVASGGCGGLAFLDGEGACEGAYCYLSCDDDDDCLGSSRCALGYCSTAGGGVGIGGTGGSGGFAPGDPVIMLDDGRITYGDLGYPPGDSGPGDAVGLGDYSGGDFGPGDTTIVGDAYLSGDVLVTGGDGVICMDPDLDGYCACCPLGLDCPAIGCADGTPGCGEYNASLHPGVVEVCDMVDNNCDGETDEGVLNGCDNCAPPNYCIEDTPWGTGAGGVGGGGGTLPGPDADPGSGSCLPDCVVIDGVVTKDEDANGYGAITLSEGTVATDFAWGANETEGTVSRVDTILGQEVGRYVTVMWRTDDPYRPYVQPWGASGSRCAEPSRTTIDGDGNAFIANRAVNGYTGQCGDSTNQLADPHDFGSLTQIAYYNRTICDHTRNPALVGCQCADRNGNGVIETSFDHDASRSIDLTGAVLSGCVSLDPSQSPYEVQDGPTCATTCGADAECVTALGPRHFCVNSACSDLPQRAEFLDIDDECVMWTVRIPGADTNADPTATEESAPRGMAIDKEGFVWVGDNQAPYHFWKIFPEPPSAQFPAGRAVFVCPMANGCCRDGDDCTVVAPIPWNAECPRTARQQSNRSVIRTDPVNECTVGDPCFWTADDSCRIDVSIGPYGAVIDSGEYHPNGFGYLWTTEPGGGRIQRIDTESGAVSRVFRATNGSVWGSAYGISIDHEDRPWLVNSSASTPATRPTVFRFNATLRDGTDTLVSNFTPGTPADPDLTAAEQAPLWSVYYADTGVLPDGRADPWGTTNWYGRGITTELLAPANPGDPVSSRVWATFNNGWGGDNNWILTFDAETGVEGTAFRTNASPGTDCRDPIGIGMGFEEKVWVVAQNSSQMCAFDPWGPLAAGGGMETSAVAPIGIHPYTYSDFTGSIFRSFTNPEGRYKILVRACPEDYELLRWGRFLWDAEVPGESVLEVKFRFGDSPFEAMDIGAPQIIGQIQTGPLPPPESFSWTPDVFEQRIYCEIEFRFLADNQGLAPILYSMDSARNCQPPS